VSWTILRIIFAMVGLAVIAVLYWLVRRAAMKHPNNGNEFSRDNEYGHI
jgi:hypothetical protein